MNNKHPMVYRRIAFSVASLLIFAGLLSTTAVVSADLNELTQTGTITLIKNVIKDNGGNGAPDNFQLTIGGSPATSGVAYVLPANTDYEINETQISGYTFISITGDPKCPASLGGMISLSEGDNITCTITNNDDPPSLTLVKIVTNDNSGLAAPVDWTLTATGPTPISGPGGVTSDATFVAGIYTLSESTGPIGYSSSNWICIGGDQVNNQITLYVGETATCTITNDDVGFNFNPDGGLLTSESGTSDSFEVVLDTKPVADVTLALHSSNTDEGTIDKASLTFTPINWYITQTITVTGVDDPVPVADGDVGYSIITGTVTTSDPDYGSLDPDLDIPDVSVVNSDNDTEGISTSPNTNLWTSEGGATETVQVSLQTQPTYPVLLNIASSNPGEGTVSPSSLTINPETWPTTKKFTITGVDDCKSGGDNYEVTITASSDDPVYNGLKEILNVTNYDAPTIGWVDPVGDEEFYDVEGFNPIQLKVKSLCPEPISKVRFYRWVVSIGDNVIIGENLTPPYTAVLDPAELELGINQVRAFAFGPPVENQTFSIHKRIFIVKEPKNYIFLPSISKNP